MKAKLIAVIGLLLLCPPAKGQINNQEERQLNMIKVEESPKIDGREEALWSQADVADNFYNHRPSDAGLAPLQTSVKVLYDDQFIYLFATLEQPNHTQIMQNLKRDNYFDNDGFGVLLDPINHQTNGFFFGVSARGSQAEGLVSATGNTDWNWDAKWYSKVQEADGYWTVEMAIPFFTLRYSADNPAWGVNFVRNDLANNRYSTWTRFSTNFSELDLGYTGRLNWASDIPIAGKKVAIIPSITTTVGEDFEADSGRESDVIPSLDLKYAVTPSLNLDLTINPDFSQIEVDRQVTNLSRFSLFFPERRTFFLENSDLFTSFGRFQVRPFFSRRIGLNNGQNIPIRFGARLTGNVTEKLRLGIMNVQTGRAGDTDPQNYGVLAAQHRVFKRSTIGGILVNRQRTSGKRDYNRVAGTEFNFSSENGRISGDVMYYKSFSDGLNGDNNFASGSLFLNTRNYRLYFQTDHVGDDFQTDVGFNPRLSNYDAATDQSIRINYQQYNLFGAIDFRPESGSMVFHGPRAQYLIYTNFGNRFNESYAYLGYEIDFANQSQFDTGINHYRVQLQFPTAFLSDEEPLPAQLYDYTDFFLDWDSDPRKLFGYGTVFTAGSFFSGNRTGLRSYIQYRVQPWLSMRLDHNYNYVDLRSYGREGLHLVGFRTELSFSNAMFWTTFLQYNTQADNFNINSRFQWRFAPMSDLFVVYTENYYSGIFAAKNRYLSVKVNYWINL